MTCEIALMNPHAIVLAADSAMTVTQWVNGQRESRYFKGTNKIFELSHHHPVGMMIFGAASLHQVPWELIVKEFRDQLDRQSFASLDGYASALFNFILSNDLLFPAIYRERLLLEEFKNVAHF